MSYEYTYTIRRVTPKQKLLGVVYHVEGRDDYFKNFSTEDFTDAGITALIEGFSSEVRAYWKAYDDQSGDSEVAEGDQGGSQAELIVQEDEPPYDPITENLVETENFDPATLTRTFGYRVDPATQTEISQRRKKRSDESKADPFALSKAQSLVALKTIDPDTLSDEELSDIAVLYPSWDSPVAYTVDEVVYYNGVLWRCVQAHTSQDDWAPEFVPALFTVYRNPTAAPQPWVQPTGAQDAYSLGEEVTHPNPNAGGAVWVYLSAINANTTEPGADGTLDRYWTPINPV